MTELSSIRDRVAVVTGGAAGIGLACAQRFISEGAKVAILDRDVEAGDRIARDFNAKGGTAISIGAECTSDDDMQTAVAEIVAK
jgi:NAD(P)-dependent dehydrogenase (short-subunit alcohol dehydrogenase family)